MALQLNLLHEEILQERQRQRDPLKIGIMVLVAVASLLVLYYLWSAYRTLEMKGRLGALDRDWAKVEPEVTAAQKRSEELETVIKSTRALDSYIDNRFFWGPFLEKVASCVAPNTQLTSLTGTVSDDSKTVDVTLDGIAAGKEPRSVAEDLRQMLLEQLTQNSFGIESRSLKQSEVGGANEDVIVDGVQPRSPAAEAGLQKGDVIRKFDGRDVKNLGDLLDLVRQVQLNNSYAVEVLRNQKPLKLKAQISEWQPDYAGVSVEFKSLEDLDQIVTVGGSHLAVVHYTLNVNVKPRGTPLTGPLVTGGTRKR